MVGGLEEDKGSTMVGGLEEDKGSQWLEGWRVGGR